VFATYDSVLQPRDIIGLLQKGHVMKSLEVLVVDSADSARALSLLLKAQNVGVKIINCPHLAENEVKTQRYCVVLLDAFAPEMQGLRLLASIRTLCPECKVVFMARQPARTLVIQALRMGVWGFLEKPIFPELCCHTVKRALEAYKFEQQYRKTLEELQLRHGELIEMNDSLTELAKTVDRVRRATACQIMQQIRSLLVPFIEKLRQNEALQRYEAQWALLLRNLEDIMSGVATHFQAQGPLSQREMQMGLMIRAGLTNEEIATQLGISLETVKVHRRNIRKKLGITGTRNRLRGYLQVLDGEVSRQPNIPATLSARPTPHRTRSVPQARGREYAYVVVKEKRTQR